MRHRLLLINPRITARRHARFPLSLLGLAHALESECDTTIIDGNVERDMAAAMARAQDSGSFDAVGVTVMGGPQVAAGIAVSKLARALMPGVPIIWGGYFATLYPDAAAAASYVDFVVRGPGEMTLAKLLDRLKGGIGPDTAAAESGPAQLDHGDYSEISGLTWKRSNDVIHNEARPIPAQVSSSIASYRLLGDPRKYLARTFLGQRTAAHQAALGCRFRCTFCGVAAMFRGRTTLPAAATLERDLRYLKHEVGADSIQFYDHNFFDREVDMEPLLDVMAKISLPWWCYARSDALLGLSAHTWSLVRRSGLRMAYIGAESPNDGLLREIRKGTRADQTLAAAELCRRQGVIPELSFMVAPPVDPEGETERTFEFIREVKRVNPHAEIIVYIYTPLPSSAAVPNRGAGSAMALVDHTGAPIEFPKTPEEWTQQRWVDYACHADAPWLDDRLRKRIRDFVTVLRCRFPTVQDVRSPPWAKGVIRAAAAWRYRFQRYDRPWELAAATRLVRLANPQTTSL